MVVVQLAVKDCLKAWTGLLKTLGTEFSCSPEWLFATPHYGIFSSWMKWICQPTNRRQNEITWEESQCLLLVRRGTAKIQVSFGSESLDMDMDYSIALNTIKESMFFNCWSKETCWTPDARGTLKVESSFRRPMSMEMTGQSCVCLVAVTYLWAAPYPNFIGIKIYANLKFTRNALK